MFENRAGVPLYVLIAQPLITHIAKPLILDHSSPGSARQVDPNSDLGFQVGGAPATETVERRLTYHLALPDSTRRATVVGQFGYGDSRPDPAWEKTRELGPGGGLAEDCGFGGFAAHLRFLVWSRRTNADRNEGQKGIDTETGQRQEMPIVT